MLTRIWWNIAILILLMCAGTVLPAQAQQFLSGPSMGLDDAKSPLRNPAVISFHRPKVSFGAKAHHLGLGSESGVPLRQGFVAGSTPFLVGDRVGLGGSIQYFDSPIFKKGAFGVSVTGRILRFLSVGARVSALNLSYNRDEFVGVEPGDPVFEGGTSKTTLTSSFGVFAKPIPRLNLAAGVQNLNRPNLALGGEAFRAERQFFGGVSYGFGAVRAHVEVSNSRHGVESLVALEAYSPDGSYLRVGSDGGFSTAMVEGQLHVGGPLSINYRYGLPIASDLRGTTSGSHLFTVVYEFGRSPEVPEPPPPPPMLLEADRSDVDPEIKPELYLTSEQDYVQHLEKRIERKIEVPREVLRSVSREAIGVLDSSFATNRGRSMIEPVDRIPENIEVSDVLSANYDSSLTQIQRRLIEDSTRTIRLLGKDEGRVKAVGMYNKLREEEMIRSSQLQVGAPADSVKEQAIQDPERIPLSEKISILNPNETTLYLLDPYLNGARGRWEVRVESRSGEVVRTFSGSGSPPGQITWDWTTNQGEPIDEGVYTYTFAWRGDDGREYESNKRKLYVRKVVRKVTIEVTADPKDLDDPTDALELRFKE